VLSKNNAIQIIFRIIKMNPKAMELHGVALLDYFNGDKSSTITIRRDDGYESPLPVSLFFRVPSEFTPTDKAAIEICKGHVLDVGGGTGLHSLVLQQKGFAVTAIDISQHAVEIMIKRGVKDVHCADIFDYSEGQFDTILMLGHGIGMVETIAGLDRFLSCVHELLTAEGQVLMDSMDVRVTDEQKHLEYLEANRKAGRYIGEIRMQFEYRGRTGPLCGWLHVDSETLKKHAFKLGWVCEVILHDGAEYLARLTETRIV
jgi:2-polyprenyl-3-methyl-5-hydroxy-6-metoxy-1,4-benzoquinol methylase